MKTARRENANSILLVIEPDAATRTGMKRLLEMSGYTITAVADAAEATSAARDKNYDLILFDSNLPPPESLAAAHEIRQRRELKNTPVLVISVHERFGAPLDNPDVDNFTVAYLADFSRFNELEKIIASLTTTKNDGA